MKYVIIGASAAGTAAAREIRIADPRGEITLVAEDRAVHSRCQLHLVASGRRTETQANFLPPNWPETFRIDLRLGERVTSLDAVKKVVFLTSGEQLPYDRLVLATGSRTFFPPVPGLQGKRTYGLRDLTDADLIRSELADCESFVVIGAGLVGIEMAMELAELGKRVAIVEIAAHPLPLQLEEETGAKARELLEHEGISLYCGERAASVERDHDGNPLTVQLASGLAISCDAIIAAAGVRANVELLADAGAKIGRGVVIDHKCRTSLPDIYAAGDCTETEDTIVKRIMPSAIWPAAIRQGQVAGINAAGGDESLTRNTGLRASVNLFGTSAISLGAVSMAGEAGWRKHVVRYTNSWGQYCIRVFYVEPKNTGEALLRGAILWGDVTNAGVYGEAIINGRDISMDLRSLPDLDGAKRGTEPLIVS